MHLNIGGPLLLLAASQVSVIPLDLYLCCLLAKVRVYTVLSLLDAVEELGPGGVAVVGEVSVET